MVRDPFFPRTDDDGGQFRERKKLFSGLGGMGSSIAGILGTFATCASSLNYSHVLAVYASSICCKQQHILQVVA